MIEIGAGDIFPDCTVIASKAQIRVQIEWCNLYEIQTFGFHLSQLRLPPNMKYDKNFWLEWLGSKMSYAELSQVATQLGNQ